MIAEELLNKCATDEERETANYFDKIGLRCVDLGFKIYDGNHSVIGEMDGIFVDDENEVIIAYEDSAKSSEVNSKITKFFTRWQSSENENRIFEDLEIPNYKIHLLYIDRSKEKKDADESSIEYLLNTFTTILYLDDFEYFDSVAEKIGIWSKNDLYNFINIAPPVNEIKISATQIYIGNTPAYVFASSPNKLLKYSYVARRRKHDSGYQRMVDFKRVSSMQKKLEQGSIIGFPNSILLNSSIKLIDNPLNKSQCPKQISLSLPNHYASCKIVDGQHRLLSFAKLTKLQQTKYTLPVVLIDNMPVEEEIRMFLDINDNPKRVDPSLRYELIAQMKVTEESREYKIKEAVNLVKNLEKTNPLKNIIYKGIAGEVKKDHITLKSIVDSLIKYSLVSNNKIKNSTSLIKPILIEINKSRSAKGYLLSNRGLNLTFSIAEYFIENSGDDEIEKINSDKISSFIFIVETNINELGKYQGAQGNKDAFVLIKEEIDKVYPPIDCLKEHSETDEIIKELPINQGGRGRHKCASCAYELGHHDGEEGVDKQDLDVINLKLPRSQRGKRRHISTEHAYNLGYENAILKNEN